MYNNGTITYPWYVHYVTFSKDQEYFVVTLYNTSQTLIYRNGTVDNLTLESTVTGKYFHRIADTSKYLLTSLDGSVKAYRNTEFE